MWGNIIPSKFINLIGDSVEQKELLLLNPREYEHPWDKKALDTLKKQKGFDKLANEFYKHSLERVLRIQYTGSYLKVTDTHFPDIQEKLNHVCKILNLSLIPELYIEMGWGIKGHAVGTEKPMIIVTRRAIDWLSKNENELLGLLGHNVGHIKSTHMMYHDMAKVLPLVGDLISGSTLGVGKMIAVGLEAYLLQWYRMSELTADRAGLLACQDFESYIKLLMKSAGSPKTHFSTIDTEEFIKQAREFQSFDYDSLDKVAKAATIMWQTHPWTVLRASELLKWVESGEYDKILDKDASDTFLCFSCGAELKRDDKFCGECGANTSTR